MKKLAEQKKLFDKTSLKVAVLAGALVLSQLFGAESKAEAFNLPPMSITAPPAPQLPPPPIPQALRDGLPLPEMPAFPRHFISIGRSGYAPAVGEIWGANGLPAFHDYEDAGWGTDKNPSTARASYAQRAALSLLIAAEARNMSLSHQIAVGEVAVRRAMSKCWNRNRRRPPSIWAILHDPGQYDQMTLGRIARGEVRGTEMSTLAAAIALSGTTNYSFGTYFQHSLQDRNLTHWIDRHAFSDTSGRSGSITFNLRSFLEALGYDPTLFNPTGFGLVSEKESKLSHLDLMYKAPEIPVAESTLAQLSY